jgi:Na+-driven multidrug efflux pump
MGNELKSFTMERNKMLWKNLIRNNLSIAIPIIISSMIVMGCSIDSAQMVSFHSEKNWYFLGLFLPINYVMLGLLESGRLCSIRNASSKKSECFELERTYLIAGMHAFFIIVLIAAAAAIFFCKLDSFYIKPEDHLYFFKFSMVYMTSYLFISTNSIFNAALFGLGKNLIALFIIVGVSFLFLFLTYVFYYYTALGLYSLIISSMIAYFIGSILAWKVLQSVLQGNIQKSNLIVSWQVCKELVNNSGVPVFLSYLIMPISLLIFNEILAHFGEEVVSSFGIAYRLQSLFMLPALALGVASGILSNRLDEAEEDLKRQYKLLAIWGSFLIGLPIMLLLFIFSGTISIFLSNTMVVQKDIEMYFYYIAWSYTSFFPLVALMTLWEQTGLAIKGLLLNILIIVLQILSGVIALKYHSLIFFYEALAGISFFAAIIILGGSLLGRRKTECITA